MLRRMFARWTGAADAGMMDAMPRGEMIEYWTPARVAQELGVHRQTVHDWVASGKLRPVAVAWDTARHTLLFDPEDVRRAGRNPLT